MSGLDYNLFATREAAFGPFRQSPGSGRYGSYPGPSCRLQRSGWGGLNSAARPFALNLGLEAALVPEMNRFGMSIPRRLFVERMFSILAIQQLLDKLHALMVKDAMDPPFDDCAASNEGKFRSRGVNGGGGARTGSFTPAARFAATQGCRSTMSAFTVSLEG
jgi:hypothetical protein